MNLDFSPADDQFRAEARAWLEENKPREKRPPDGAAARDFDTAWQRRQYDAGWAGISWPKRWGGRNLAILQQLIWYEEYARARAPSIGVNFVGLSHAGPTLMERGTEEQQAAHLPRILAGEEVWCQGFSEPGAGSDLASLSTRGRVDGGELVVNGRKIWTSFANLADFQELLVRTDPDAPKRQGLTWVICDMRSPGIEVRPIRNITGQEEFCEVSYDDVRIPLSQVVGGLDDGWSVAMSTLSFERGTAFMAQIIDLANQVDDVIARAQQTPGPLGQRTAFDDDRVRSDLGELRAEVNALRSLNFAVVSRSKRGERPGPESSIIRFYYSQLLQRTHRLAVEIIGANEVSPAGFSPWAAGYANSFRATIAAGTQDIQRNIIGERLLGLPKDRS